MSKEEVKKTKVEEEILNIFNNTMKIKAKGVDFSQYIYNEELDEMEADPLEGFQIQTSKVNKEGEKERGRDDI